MLLYIVLLVGVVSVALLISIRAGRRRPARTTALRGRYVGVGGTRQRGRVVLSPAGASWRLRGDLPMDLRGPVVHDSGGDTGQERGRVRLQVQTAHGAPLVLDLSTRDAAAVACVLSSGDVPGVPAWRPRPRRGGGWAIACLVLAVGWVTLMLVLASDGYTAEATVLRSEGGWTCDVSWSDARGHLQQDESDCFDEPVGATIEVLVPWGDFRGAVTTRPMLAFVGAVGASPLLLLGGLLLRSAARRRHDDAVLLELTGSAYTTPPALDAERSALGVPATRAAADGARQRARAAVATSAAALVAAFLIGGVMARADADLHARGVRTVGTVVEVQPDGRYSSGGAEVSFPSAGGQSTRHVDLGGYADDYSAGDQVDVLYDPAQPDRLTIDDVPYEPPWTTWPMVVAVLGTLIGGPLASWLLATRRRTRRLLSAGAWAPVRILVWQRGERCRFATLDGSEWQASVDGGWPGSDLEPDEHGSAPTEAGPGGRDAWWVRDGDRAVFSPDQGGPLVLARLRRSAPAARH